MIIFTTKQMIEDFGNEVTNNKIYRFRCKLEKKIEIDLKNRIVKSDLDRNTVTYFILDDINEHKILAFFTLKFGKIESSLLGETVLENESDDKFKSAYYIVFLARDDNVDVANKANLRGPDILNAAIEQIDDVRNKVGGVNVVLIDAYTSKEKVCNIYERYGFTKIPPIGDRANLLTHFFMKLHTGD
jgi:hypothetical protein